MKRTLFFTIALVFIASLSFSQTKVNINNLEEYGGAMFKIDDNKPYSGRVFTLYKNTDNKKLEGLYRDGLKNVSGPGGMRTVIFIVRADSGLD